MVRAFAALFPLMWTVACAEGPVSYDVTAVAPLVSTDSLETLSVIRARELGFTTYQADAALRRLQDLRIGVNVQDDFMLVDRRVTCGSWITHSPFCKQVDFLIVSFPLVGGRRVVWVSAGTDRHPDPLSQWRLLKASTAIREAADSMAGAFGTVQVLNGH